MYEAVVIHVSTQSNATGARYNYRVFDGGRYLLTLMIFCSTRLTVKLIDS